MKWFSLLCVTSRSLMETTIEEFAVMCVESFPPAQGERGSPPSLSKAIKEQDSKSHTVREALNTSHTVHEAIKMQNPSLGHSVDVTGRRSRVALRRKKIHREAKNKFLQMAVNALSRKNESTNGFLPPAPIELFFHDLASLCVQSAPTHQRQKRITSMDTAINDITISIQDIQKPREKEVETEGDAVTKNTMALEQKRKLEEKTFLQAVRACLLTPSGQMSREDVGNQVVDAADVKGLYGTPLQHLEGRKMTSVNTTQTNSSSSGGGGFFADAPKNLPRIR